MFGWKSTPAPVPLTRTHGKCHICTRALTVQYCSTCHHWFCDQCQRRYLARGVAAVKHLLGPKTRACCGPEALR